MSSEPPEEPHSRSEPNTLSPASPKPIHFPTSVHIPVLQKQMDVDFNQTEAHMSDPAMHNTEIRPDFWRDPEEQKQEQTQIEQQQQQQQAQDGGITQNGSSELMVIDSEINTVDSTQPLQNEYSQIGAGANQPAVQPAGFLSSFSSQSPSDQPLHQSVVQVQSQNATPSIPQPEHHVLSVPAEAGNGAIHRPSSAAQLGTVDVQALLDNLHSAPSHDGSAVATVADAQPSPSNATGVAKSPLPASSLSTNAAPTSLGQPQDQFSGNPNATHDQQNQAVYNADQSNAQASAHAVAVAPSDPAQTQTPQLSEAVQHSNSSLNGTAVAGGSTTTVESSSIEQSRLDGSGAHADATYPSNLNTAVPAPDFISINETSQNNAPTTSRRQSTLTSADQAKPEERPWNAEIQRKYDHFLEEERKYVNEGRWEQFPQGSRLFVGNLSSERVTKRDIYHVFHTYGDLAQISIKQAYGFVQFLRAEDCARALDAEQGTPIREKRIHLEISKPQKSRGQARARSRSPDHGRGKGGSNVDRYVSGRNGRSRGGRNRSPSPRGHRDRYDDRYRARSRSPDYGRGGGGGGRYRSPSPRRDMDDDLPLPRRNPRDVPDVQIIVLDQLDRDFIAWVEKAFSSRGVRVDVLLLSPRLSEQAVVRRQIVEGVLAVSKLTRSNQISSKIGLQIFDRRGGQNNVKFEEYDNLDPSICAELVVRAKYPPAAHGGNPYQQAPPSYAYGQQQPPPAWIPPPQQAPSYSQGPAPATQGNAGSTVPPHLQSLITNLDSTGLQNLLSAMNTPQNGAPPPNPYAASMPPSASTLHNPSPYSGYLQPQQPMQQQRPQPPPQQQPLAPPSSAGAPPGQQVNMSEILARLGTYKQ